MRCDELYRLLIIYKRQEDAQIVYQLIATHIRSCSSCARGLSSPTRSIASLLALDTLTCEQCRAHFPGYYEATHPDHPQVALPDVVIARVALHLGGCRDCHQQYEALAELSEMEEMGL